MENSRLKYLGYSIVLQEVPNELSLAINISGCPHKCEGCHSKYLWKYDGNYLNDDLPLLVKKYDRFITCVCFMGGDQNMQDLKTALEYVKSLGLKTCVYSGSDDKDIFNKLTHLLDYLKIGGYHDELGGLTSESTNQKMYNISNGKEIIFYSNKS